MANNLIAVFAIFGGLLFMMTVLQMILTNYGKEDTKSFYFTFCYNSYYYFYYGNNIYCWIKIKRKDTNDENF